MFQLGCQVIIAYWALQVNGIVGCQFSIPKIAIYFAYALASLNLVGLFAIRCSTNFPRCSFFVVFILDVLLAGAILTINAMNGYESCAASKVLYQFSIIEPSIALLVCLVIFLMRLAWGQRYTNSPGNLVWPILFLPYQWSSSFSTYMQIIGIGTAVVSLVSLCINLSTMIKTSTSTRKLVMVGWIFGILILLILEGLGVYKYLNAGNVTEYVDAHAKATLAVFIGVNLIDVLFWLWGTKSLDYEKGDQVREDLFVGKQDVAFTNSQHI